MPLRIYVFFIISLIVCGLLSRYVPVIRQMLSRFAVSLETRAFPTSTPYEFKKFALLRIALGLIVFVRGLSVYAGLLETEYFTSVGIWNTVEIIAGALLVIGFLTQWALIFLAGFMWHLGDIAVAKSTLGNDIAAILAVLLFLVNAGKYLSVDAQLVKYSTRIRRVFLYYDGTPNQETISLAKFSAIASYWAVCVYSVAIHLNEPAWMDGSAGPLLLANNFMSKWHEYFTLLFASSELAVALAKGSLWMMMLWYPAVLPFVLLGGYFRQYVIIWGWLFFALSLFVLQLGYLAEIEILLWLALFWTSVGLHKKSTLQVLYDDRCNLCDRTIQFITFIDLFGQIKLRPLSQNKTLLNEHSISEEQALTDLFGIRTSDRSTYQGYDFYIQLSKTLIFLWPVLPLLLLGKALRFGPVIYRFIAARRTKLFGVCVLPRKKFLREEQQVATQSRLAHGVTLHIIVIITLFLAATPLPYLGWTPTRHIGAQAAHLYGIPPINVFNKTDLRMAENWFVIRSLDFDERLPIFAEDGSRLSMHKSDRVYFGHTLRIRRRAIGKACQFELRKPMIDYLTQIYLQQRKASSGDYTFHYKQYNQPLASSEEIKKNQFIPAETRLFCESTYTLSYLK